MMPYPLAGEDPPPWTRGGSPSRMAGPVTALLPERVASPCARPRSVEGRRTPSGMGDR